MPGWVKKISRPSDAIASAQLAALVRAALGVRGWSQKAGNRMDDGWKRAAQARRQRMNVRATGSAGVI